ncbi:unnamed protein product [Didymodactylos carnosus]|uniref:Uncharacterized protein n=2 Tax=Didymodactylos carnosus TaxID=1234261 RepID=A0A814KIC3_9BILA|nr:unnamed protein product [Didymodactylos carnosus]CAF3821713.1 unnamed protein product [Didymodactylos carnosus]
MKLDDTLLIYKRLNCSCTRQLKKSILVIDETKSSLCSQFSTLRGENQSVISISLFGPKENAMFSFNRTITFLYELIADMYTIYPGWILRIHHDSTIGSSIICQIECQHLIVDFCDMDSVPQHGNVSDFVPPKIWRFLPAGDTFVKVMNSRDLDSALTQRELDAVTEWLKSNKSFHTMRDHPYHGVPMLGGMWGFRTELNRAFSSEFLKKILDRNLISRYGGRGDQTFLSDQIWPRIQNDVIAHDSFLCQTSYGKNSHPFPTRRPPFNQTNCFIGCVRPCCGTSKPFSECPIACRPKNHADWTAC